MKNKYFMLFILYLCFFTISINQYKIPPVMDMISESFNISLSQASWLMSVFTLAGIILSVPGAAIMNKIGSKNLLLSLMASLFIGNLMGYFANNYTMLLLSRAIEGISFAMAIIVSLVMINIWFSDGGIGLALGIYNTSGAVGIFVIMNMANPIVRSFGLKSTWLLFSVLSIISFVMVWFFIQVPKLPKGNASVEKVSFIEAVKNGKSWVLALMMACVAFSLVTYITTYPQLFGSYYNIDTGKANFYASLNGLFGIIACFTCGIIVDKIKKPILICLIGFIGLAFTGYFMDLLGPSTYVLHIISGAILSGYVIISIQVVIPIIAKKRIFIGYTTSFVKLLNFIGTFLSTPVILGTVAVFGWGVAKYIMTAIGLAGAVLTVLLLVQMKDNHSHFTSKI